MKSPSYSWPAGQNEDNTSNFSLESSVFCSEEHPNKNPIDVFVINVGGSRFVLSQETLSTYPETRLGKLAVSEQDSMLELCDDANFVDNEYFFDRSSQTFKYIINYYKTGRLHVNEELCAMSFLQEIEYWGIDELSIDACCRDKYYKRKEMNEALDIKRDTETTENEEEDFSGVKYEKLRQKLWDMMEKPDSSMLAKTFGVLSVIFVIISIANMALFSLDDTALEPPLLNALEYLCITWFTAEFILRFLCVKNKCKFMKCLVNIIDIIAIIPFYITLLVEQLYGSFTELENVGRVVQILRLTRSLRMLKLGRHSTGLRSLGMTIALCYEEVGMLLLFLSVGISIFSTVEYAVEHTVPDTTFSSVPCAWWWATTSMTTVGYGDIRPETTIGKIVAFLCILTGILVLSLPIAIINDRFSSCYFTLKMKEAALRHREALKKLTKNSVSDTAVNINLRDIYARSIMEMLRIKSRERESTRSSAGDDIW
ncbi:potassium voltage-gated channel subfamily V member 1 [Callorhinchus milii]|uniref:Potassium voltage-gated channel modifier subfamily V member 1 n=1 Tax=Callorhinchus milii TaxID=7868 RepID=A0A4W3I6I6_CALMI|nr:potassium voltage-gated channel subfamily V member 1 [Callorhinchus milii]XP_007899846.1 potassium voltage-gated channel subfamily V member 1 [Callorhinchus milii]|eukprot:gi/632967202/ref/XP_007899845.1/ PREDICTED: potassium voltage-gated channel subfamily V member 1 [Callorhinchus milii]